MKDLTGLTFGRLTVIKKVKNWYYLYKCKCGNYKTVRTDHLKNGDVKSCGCLQKETSIKLASKLNVKHRLSQTPLYHVFYAMNWNYDKIFKGIMM